MYFQIRGEKSWNWWLWSGSQEGDLRRKELEGGALNWRRKKRRKVEVWVTPLCGSFSYPFLSPTKGWRHKLKVTVDIFTSHLFPCSVPTLHCFHLQHIFSLSCFFFLFFTHRFIHWLKMWASAVLILSQNHMSGFPAKCTETVHQMTWLRRPNEGQVLRERSLCEFSIIKTPHMGRH